MCPLNAHIAIVVSPDGYEAHALDDGSHLPVALNEIGEILSRAGVVYGVIDEALQKIAGGEMNGQPLLVARGAHPAAGEDGWVEYFFDKEHARPVEEKSGKVDLREMNFVHNAVKGDRLALRHPPVPGTPGMTVKGKPVPPPEGKKPVLRSGAYTAFAPENPDLLLANGDGNVVLRLDGTIEVQPLLVLSGNVDFSTGNIDFVGSLRVLGDIKSEFAVKVRQDLEVLGNIEDAQVDVGGNVKVAKGFLGTGKGNLKAGGNIVLQHLLNQTVVGAKDVVIEKESVNGTIRAGERILSPRGTFAGGFLEADVEVDVENLGAGEHSQTRVRVGRKGRILERLAQIEKESQLMDKQISDVKEAVFKLIRLRLDVTPFPPEKEQLLTKLQDAQKSLPVHHEKLQEEKKGLQEDLKVGNTARIVVRGTVFEDVVIDINGIKKVVEASLKDVAFVERAGTIEVRSL